MVQLVLGTATSLSDLVAPGALSDDLSMTTVRGFPAALARPRANPFVCFLDVSVNEGQTLELEFGDGGQLQPIAQDQLCAGVTALADQAMETLVLAT